LLIFQIMQENKRGKRQKNGDGAVAPLIGGGDVAQQQSDGTDGEDEEPAVAQPDLD
jgi:hypothetical protein